MRDLISTLKIKVIRMKKFYLLRLASDPKLIGASDGGSQAEIVKKKFLNKDNYDLLIKVLGSNEYWSYKDKLPEIPLVLERAELSQNAILTDALHFSPVLIDCPFLLSRRVKDIFAQGNCSNLIFFETSVFSGDKKFSYYLIHFERLSDQLIDFEKSTFFVGDDLLGKQDKKFSSAEEKQNYCLTNFDLGVDTLFIKGGDHFNSDIFCLGSGELVISETIKKQLDDMGATGLVMLPAFGNDRKWPAIELVG